MSDNLIAHATTSIRSSKDRVWDALVDPDAIKHYMFGADVESDWREGSAITWSGEAKGRRYRDKGVILRIEPDRTLCYGHFSPQSGKPDRPENYHIVTIRLAGQGDRTEVYLSQDNNADEDERKASQKNWDVMLDGLKKYVENEMLVDACQSIG
jgi:uncharacterized protein YndB with AHSA1/START domain